jgi:hypothetical protein
LYGHHGSGGWMPMLDIEELIMTKVQYKGFEALNPFFGVVMEGIRDSSTANTISTLLPKAQFSNLAITFPAGLRSFEDAPI